IMVNSAYPKRFNKLKGGLAEIMEKVKQRPELRMYELVISKALSGQYQGAKQMREEILLIHQPKTGGHSQSRQQAKTRSQKSSSFSKQANIPPARNRTVQPARRSNKKKKKSSALETITIILIISLLYFIYIYSQIT
ncbi:MAG TPA: serine/threonine protein kinase, partial [Bacillus bacterium]|nr:serine/threonine protein kinase [Bacillus sp. (in: firmicutes)]